MADALIISDAVVLSVVTLITLSFFISSIWEKEKRASVISGIQFLIMVVFLVLFFYLNNIGFFAESIGLWVLITGTIAALIMMILLLLPIGANLKALEGTRGLITGDVKRVDERETVFSRIYNERLARAGNPSEPPTKGFTHGGFKRSANLSLAQASDTVTRQLAARESIAPEVAENKTEISPEEASKRVKGFAGSLGAVLTGITELDPRWLYSHRGKSGVRNDEWGREIDIDHRFAIVFAMEMDVDMIASSPDNPVMIESMRNYAKGAFIGAGLAAFIANLGYPAISNQMAHYDAMMVPLAVDAGLGELSRMGYLITKEYGPRVRLGAVTTNLPLIPDKPVDIGVVDFCRKCLKCAHCCPTNSIPTDDRKVVNGSLRWTIETDSCHQYWRKIGTDCAICMRVCPWSHARTFPHQLITEAVSRNSHSRTLFNWMDALFYGKRPPKKPPPVWARSDPADPAGMSDDLIE